MKSIKQRISDNQDFYNGVTVGIGIGFFAAMMLVARGAIIAVPTREVY